MPNPIDQLMLDIIAGQKTTVTPAERQLILGRIASSRFNDERRTLREWFDPVPTQSLTGWPHPSDNSLTLSDGTVLTSFEYHVVKHTLDGNWPKGTTLAEYVSDLRVAVQHPGTLLDVGREILPAGYPRSRAATRTHAQGLPTVKMLPKLGRCLFVIYDPARGRLLTGFMKPHATAEAKLNKWENRRSL